MKLLSSLFLALSLSFPVLAQKQTIPLTITSYNIENFDSKARTKGKTNLELLASLIKETDSDLLAVQEIVNTQSFARFVQNYLPEYDFVLSQCGGSGRQNLGFLYRFQKIELLNYWEDNSIKPQKNCRDGLRPAFIGSFRSVVHKTNFVAIVVHLKAGGDPRDIVKRQNQLKALEQLKIRLNNQGHQNSLILGDFNTTEFLTQNQHRHYFDQFVQRSGHIDPAKKLLCTSYWWGAVKDETEYPSHLDHILVSQGLSQQFSGHRIQVGGHCQKLSCQRQKTYSMGKSFNEVSDHCPVTLTLF